MGATVTKRIEIEATTLIGNEEYEVTVCFDYEPESRGSRDAFGAQIEPDEPAELIFISADIHGYWKGQKVIDIERVDFRNAPDLLIQEWREQAQEQL